MRSGTECGSSCVLGGGPMAGLFVGRTVLPSARDQRTFLHPNADATSTYNQTQVTSGTQNVCVQLYRANHPCSSGSSAFAKVARSAPFNIPSPNCTTSATLAKAELPELQGWLDRKSTRLNSSHT